MPLLHPYVHPDQRTICQRRMMTMLAGLGKSKMKPDNLQYKYQASWMVCIPSTIYTVTCSHRSSLLQPASMVQRAEPLWWYRIWPSFSAQLEKITQDEFLSDHGNCSIWSGLLSDSSTSKQLPNISIHSKFDNSELCFYFSPALELSTSYTSRKLFTSVELHISLRSQADLSQVIITI